MLVAVLVLAGVVFRLWFVLSPLGLVDGDEAVVGLMARRALEGSFEAFFWGQEYGGSQEALLVAALLAIGVPGRWAMELVPIGLHAIAAVLVWRIGLRTVSGSSRGSGAAGRRNARRTAGAALAAGLYWGASPALIWWSTKARGLYGATLVCGLIVVLLVVRLDPKPIVAAESGALAPDPAPKRLMLAGLTLGLAAGMGWWASPQILHFVVPGALWLLWTHRRALERLPILIGPALLGGIVGAAPWLWANAHTGFASLETGGVDRAVFGEPYEVFFRYGVPMVLGLRAPITLGWRFPGAEVVYAVVLAGLAALLVMDLVLGLRGARPLRPVLLATASYPTVFALLPTTYYYGEPRYLDFLFPFLALVGGWALGQVARRSVRIALVVALLAVTTEGVRAMTQLEGPPTVPYEDISPRPVDDVVDVLADHGVDRAFADYWLAYRLAWETDGRILATPFQPVRSPRIDEAVRRADRPAYVTVAGSCLDRRLLERLEAEAIPHQVERADQWHVVVLEDKVLPEELLPDLC